MTIGEICNRKVVVSQRNDSVLQAAKLMRQYHVGDVVVVEERNGYNVPVGIVTDRDIIVEITAPELDPKVITVEDFMASNLVTIREDSGISEAVQLMQKKGIRRLPVVDDKGGLVGIVTLDDLLVLLVDELNSLSRLVDREQKNEASSRP